MASVWTQNFYPRGDGVAFDRVIFFSDAVFAIALTLAAVEIGLPEVEGDPNSVSALWDAIVGKGPALVGYLVAFIWVAIYWRANHRFVLTLRGMDSRYVFATIVYLALIALLPVPAEMLGEFWGNSSWRRRTRPSPATSSSARSPRRSCSWLPSRWPSCRPRWRFCGGWSDPCWRAGR